MRRGRLHAFVKAGGKLKDLRKRILDRGLAVESAIGFASWIVDDDAKRARGFEQAKRDMDILAQLGGLRIDSFDRPKRDTLRPPVGAGCPAFTSKPAAAEEVGRAETRLEFRRTEGARIATGILERLKTRLQVEGLAKK